MNVEKKYQFLNQIISKEDNKFNLPSLKFSFNDFENILSSELMELHITKHHQSYIKNLNNIINSDFIHLLNSSPSEICEFILKNTPFDNNHLQNENYNALFDLKNNFFGHLNHSFFWSLLTNNNIEPSSNLKKHIESNFGSWDKFIALLTSTGLRLFGSGWVWLVVDEKKKLSILTTQNQDHVWLYNRNVFHILAIDLWEHAYYLDYQSDKKEYFSNFLSLINWDEVESLLLEQQ